jgi:Major Facilitator Superfamily
MLTARNYRPMIGLLLQSGLMRLSDQMAGIVYGWAILQATGSGTSASLVIASSLGSLIVGTLFAGRLIAAFGPRTIALTGSWLSAAAAIGIAALFAFGQPEPILVALLAAGGALLDGPAGIATETNYPTVARLARVNLVRLNAIDDGLDHVASLIAPATGASIMAFGGPDAGATAVALLAVPGALILTISLPNFRVAQGAQAFGLLAAMRTLREDALLFPLTILFSLVLALFFATELVLLPLLLAAKGLGPQELAYFLAAAGIGGIVGAAMSGISQLWLSLRVIVCMAFLVLASGLVILAADVDPWRLVLAGLVIGLPAGLVSPLAATLYQSRPPKVQSADIQAISGALIIATAPVAVLITGFLADRFGAKTLLPALAVALVLLAMAAFITIPRSTGASSSEFR